MFKVVSPLFYGDSRYLYSNFTSVSFHCLMNSKSGIITLIKDTNNIAIRLSDRPGSHFLPGQESGRDCEISTGIPDPPGFLCI